MRCISHLLSEFHGTSTESSLRIKDISSQGHRLCHDAFVKGHFLGVVQAITDQCGAKHILHGFLELGLIAHQGQSRVDVASPNLGNSERGN